MTAFEQIKAFYRKHLPQAEEKAKHLTAPCPFCSNSADQTTGKIDIDVDERSYFRGYFTCTVHCNEGGFHFHFGALMGIEADGVPGFDPDATPYAMDVAYPNQHLETEITQFISLLGDAQAEHFARFGVTRTTLGRLKVGFNGRYLVYPYIQETGLAYAARCVMPGRPGDNFWHGNESFSEAPFNIYNVREIDRCKGGALIITEGEPNLLILKELGYPAISVPAPMDLSGIPAQRLEGIDHVFLLVANTPEALQSASKLAVNLGFKARILSWPANAKRGATTFRLGGGGCRRAGPKPGSHDRDVEVLFTLCISGKRAAPAGRATRQRKRPTDAGLENRLSEIGHRLGWSAGYQYPGRPPKSGQIQFFYADLN
jgi:replicative DNA helicase